MQIIVFKVAVVQAGRDQLMADRIQLAEAKVLAAAQQAQAQAQTQVLPRPILHNQRF